MSQSITFSPLIIGTMRLGEWGAKMSTQELETFIDQCLEMGLNDFDHADIYGHYSAETEFGEVLKRRKDLRSKLQITTKCGIKLVTERRPDHKIQSYNSTKKYILACAENSLKELKIEQIELLLLHRPDFLMNPYDVAVAFERLKIEGKVNAFGVSNYSPSQFELLNSFTPLINNQVEISLTHRKAFEDGTLDQCLQHKIIPTAWSPLGGGAIFSKSEDPTILRIQKTAGEIAEKHQSKIDQILLAWILKHPAKIIPVLGTTKIKRIQDALGALEINLTHEEWYELWVAAAGVDMP